MLPTGWYSIILENSQLLMLLVRKYLIVDAYNWKCSNNGCFQLENVQLLIIPAGYCSIFYASKWKRVNYSFLQLEIFNLWMILVGTCSIDELFELENLQLMDVSIWNFLNYWWFQLENVPLLLLSAAPRTKKILREIQIYFQTFNA